MSEESLWEKGYLCGSAASILRRACIEVFLYLGEIIGLGCFVERGVVLSGGDVVSCCEGEVSCVVCVGVGAGDDCVDVSCVDGAGVSCVDGEGVSCAGVVEGSVMVVGVSFVWVSRGFVGMFCSRVCTTDCIVGVSSLNVLSCDMSEMSMPMLKRFFMFALRIVW